MNGHFACSISSLLQVATGLIKPCCVSHLLGGWLGGFSKELKPLLLLGARLLVGPFGLVEMILSLKIKTCSSSAGIYSVIH